MPPTLDDFITVLNKPYNVHEGPGGVYVHARVNKQVLLDWIAGLIDDYGLVHLLDLKVGSTNNIDRRRGEYHRRCKGEVITWYYWIPSFHRIRLEDLVHLAIDYLGARARLYPCVGCGVVHCEHCSAWTVGEPEGLEVIIHLYQALLGETSQRQDLNN
ncbi:hypothetical protein DFH09DRAFT_1318084 [Mycena vulgaris]|nr:hypothetical protein DFH09DRAFT_1318084 [Mycena vulgaris]